MSHQWRMVNVEPMDDTGETYRRIRETSCELILGRDGWKYPGDEYSEEEVIELCEGADAIIGGSRERYTRRIFESLPNLRIMSKHGTGTDRIDLKAATEVGILVTHTPVNSAAVAEHTIALMLAAMKKVREADKKVRAGGWRDHEVVATLVGGKTLGILGFGRIGSEIAKRLQGWGLKILVYDPYANPDLLARQGVERCEHLSDMLERVDVLSVNAVLTKETRNLIGKDTLKRLKKSAYIVNSSRGEIIDEKALARALREGEIAGAALDVMAKEPPDPENDLLGIENVILTPHMSAWTPEMNWMLAYTAMENALTALRGEVPKYVKNPEVIETWLSRFGKKPAEVPGREISRP